MSRPKIYRLLTLILIAVALHQLGRAGYIYAKAQLAQRFIAEAWQQSLATGKNVRPWSWADHWPVARLQYHSDEVDKDLYILAGSSGSSLAFGPGHNSGTAEPGSGGNSLIGGHRDTHFAFLKNIKIGEIIRVQNRQGKWRNYRISATAIKHIERDPLLLDSRLDQLQLITCYPFTALKAGGPLRFQVTATRTNL